MSVAVNMPQLGESVTEGTVTRWLKKEGEHVTVDEPLLEVSTDKVDTEIPSPATGILRGIAVDEDETVAVGAQLAVIEEAGADRPPPPPPPPRRPSQLRPLPRHPASYPRPPTGRARPGRHRRPRPPTQPAPPAPASGRPRGQHVVVERPGCPARPGPSCPACPGPGRPSRSRRRPRPRRPASRCPTTPTLSRRRCRRRRGPVRHATGAQARRRALGSAGRDHRHRRRRADPQAGRPGGRARAAGRRGGRRRAGRDPGPRPRAPRPGTGRAGRPRPAAAAERYPSALRGTTERMSRPRQVIAKRMVESLQTSAQLTTVVEADVTGIARLRDRAKDAFEAREGVKLTFLPFVTLADHRGAQAAPEAQRDHRRRELAGHLPRRRAPRHRGRYRAWPDGPGYPPRGRPEHRRSRP